MTVDKLKRFAVLIGLIFGVVAMPVAPAGAINVFNNNVCNTNTNDTEVCKGKGETIAPIIQSIVNTLLFVIGTVSVIMIIVGGIRYTTSNGDAGRVKQAKDTILYSVVGLVVALSAFVIVNFVVNQFG
jgi:ABC-type Fe3+ transport system permease subunit